MQNSKTFINENNNEVTFGVGCKDGLVVLVAKGPETSTEWEITHNEARELYKLLGAYLSAPFVSAEYYHG